MTSSSAHGDYWFGLRALFVGGRGSCRAVVACEEDGGSAGASPSQCTPPHGGWRGLQATILTALLSMILSLGSGLSMAATPTSSLPTTDELRQLFQQHKYRPLLQKLDRVLALTGQPARDYDRYEILTLKGETLLQVGSSSGAADAFADAQKQASAPQDQAAAYAMTLLIQRSHGHLYMPKAAAQGAASPQAIDIRDSQQRKAALNALFLDDLAAAGTQIQAGRQGKSLPPIMDAAGTLHDLRLLETAATADQTRTGQIAEELAQHARDLMAQTLQTMHKQTAAMRDHANELVEQSASDKSPKDAKDQPASKPAEPPADATTEPSTHRYHKRGLTAENMLALAETKATCGKFAPAAQSLAEALQIDLRPFDPVLAEAVRTASEADSLLNADFSGTYRNREGS